VTDGPPPPCCDCAWPAKPAELVLMPHQRGLKTRLQRVLVFVARDQGHHGVARITQAQQRRPESIFTHWTIRLPDRREYVDSMPADKLNLLDQSIRADDQREPYRTLYPPWAGERRVDGVDGEDRLHKSLRSRLAASSCMCS